MDGRCAIVWIAGVLCAAAAAAQPAPPGAQFDAAQRLVAWPGKHETACPRRSPRVATILILGQSNAGNHAQSVPLAMADEAVLNWHAGRCHVAASPLLGATGWQQEPWTSMARSVLASGKFDRVVLAPIAVAGSPIARWVGRGDLRPVLMREATQLQDHLDVTAVLWLQGEADFGRATGERAYTAALGQVVASIRSAGIDAPVHVYTATWCLDPARWTADNPVARAQRGVLAWHGVRARNVSRGVDIDALLRPEDRFDGCHLSESGVRQVARATARLLGAATP